MKKELWRRAEDLFHAALERSADARRAFLDEACAGDADLRRTVETLLSKDAKVGSFLEEPVLVGVAAEARSRGALLGRRCGAYQIFSFLGAGGMGDVYRAHDDTLGRDVAVKSLPPEFASDPGRLARFRREARTLASLNHPNVAAIYGLEESADAHILVLELVEGETPRGPLPLAEALDCARQVAAALQAAHEHGIVHRDLKPANIKITPQGVVKVLDFGLAKAIWGREERPEGAPPAGAGADGSVTGHVLGTPAYMSPEQAQGKAVDARTDIWSFGCLLYELLTGRRAFGREGFALTAAAVLDDEPDWQALPAGTPRRVRDLLRQCLQKDPNRRPSSIGDVLTFLKEPRKGRHGTAPGATAPPARARRPSAGRIRSLAVLPLANLSRDPGEDYFVDGMTEALIAELAQIHALRVISRTSAMHFKGTTLTVPEIARELGVDGIVEGSVTRAGDRVRITAQLVRAASDEHLWARSYERDLQDVLRLQGDVARAIADEIEVMVTPQESARLSRVRPANVEAHEAYIRGRYLWGRAQPGRSIEHYRQAIAIDPDYAPPYSGIADDLCMLYGAAISVVPPDEAVPEIRASALKAIDLDRSLADPHVSMARILFWYDRDPVGAERELRLAVQLNPNCAMAYFHLGLLHADLGRRDEAFAALQRAEQVDPVSCWNDGIAGWFVYELGAEERGLRQVRRSLELDPGFHFAWGALSVLHSYEGRHSEAIDEARESVRLSGGVPMSRGWMGYVLARAGRRAEARVILDELEAQSRARYVPASAWAWALMGLGERERVIDWLEKGYERHDSWLPHMGVGGFRAFEPLHSDPHVQDLLRRLGVPSQAARAGA